MKSKEIKDLMEAYTSIYENEQIDQVNDSDVQDDVDLFDIVKCHLIDEGYADTEEAALAIMTNMSEVWKNDIVERYAGRHGQTATQYANSRSPGGSMVSGTGTMSGAEYTHGSRVKAANPGMQPNPGGSTKPGSQGRMDSGTRADMRYRQQILRNTSKGGRGGRSSGRGGRGGGGFSSLDTATYGIGQFDPARLGGV